MKGIDISGNNGANIDFAKVKRAGYEAVYIKATEGLSFVNPCLMSQYNGAKAQGLKVGFYHYMRANDAIAEAKHFLAITSTLTADMLYALDYEVTDGLSASVMLSRAVTFMDYLNSQGKPPVLYTYDSFYSTYFKSITKYPLWVAHYGVSKPDVTTYVGFQYSESGVLDGVRGSTDLNVFYDGIMLPNSVNNGWYLENSNWHYYANNVQLMSGWAQDYSKRWYYLENGETVKNGWELYQGKSDTQAYWYFFGADGTMFINQWAYWDEDAYYLGSDGKMLANCKTPDGYFVDSTGAWDRKAKA